MRTTVILPAHNEELSIAATVSDIRKYSPHSSIVVINNASSDRTEEIARGMEVIVVNILEKGKGNAIRGAIPFLNRDDNIIMLDSDFTYPADNIPRMVHYLNEGNDVVVGYRKWKAPNAMPQLNAIGNKGLSLLASCLYGYPVTDVCTGLWGFRPGILHRLSLKSTHFTLEAELFENVRKLHCKIRQYPITYRARPDGSVPKLKVSDGVKIALFLIKNRVRRLK